MTKLSDPQAALLTEAANAEDGAVVAPDGAKSTIAGLIRRGLMLSLPQEDGPSRLVITEAGRAAVAAPKEAVEPTGAAPEVAASGAAAPDAPSKESAGPEPSTIEPLAPEPPARQPKRPSKLQAVVALLQRPDGASVDEMMAATGWQAHSVRGSISGGIKKGLGHEVLSEKTEAGRRYRIPAKGSEAVA